MIDEIDDVELSPEDPTRPLDADSEEKAGFFRRFHKDKEEIICAQTRDTLTWNGGSSSKRMVMLLDLMGTSLFCRAPLTAFVQGCCRGSLDIRNTSNTLSQEVRVTRLGLHRLAGQPRRTPRYSLQRARPPISDQSYVLLYTVNRAKVQGQDTNQSKYYIDGEEENLQEEDSPPKTTS